MDRKRFDSLCASCGIEPAYRDVWGNERIVPDETRLALLRAMGLSVASDRDVETALAARDAQAWRRMLPQTRVARSGTGPFEIDVVLEDRHAKTRFECGLVTEDGARRAHAFVPAEQPRTGQRLLDGSPYTSYRLALGELPPCGYHRLEIAPLENSAAPRATMALVTIS